MAGPRRRPRRPHGTGRRVEVRFTDTEYASIRDAAAGPGRGVSVARFVADAALTTAGVSRPPPVRAAPSRVALAEIAEAVAAVSRVGNNLNQLAREKNATGWRPVGSREVEQRVLAALGRLAEICERQTGSRS